MEKNRQPIEDLSLDTEGNLEVHSIWRTIQGEGPLAGTPAAFVRLAGCNLRCVKCDTDYTSRRDWMSVDQVIHSIGVSRPGLLVVITGGEPFRQNVLPLVRELLRTKHKVQIETNGTTVLSRLPVKDPNFTIVCSPKTSKVDPFYYGTKEVNWKYVIKHDYVDYNDGLPVKTVSGARPARPDWYRNLKQPVFVQPMDEKDILRNEMNTKAAVESCLRFGYRLSLQMQKIVGVA